MGDKELISNANSNNEDNSNNSNNSKKTHGCQIHPTAKFSLTVGTQAEIDNMLSKQFDGMFLSSKSRRNRSIVQETSNENTKQPSYRNSDHIICGVNDKPHMLHLNNGEDLKLTAFLQSHNFNPEKVTITSDCDKFTVKFKDESQTFTVEQVLKFEEESKQNNQQQAARRSPSPTRK